MAFQISKTILVSFLLVLSLYKTNGDSNNGEKMTHLHFYFHEILSGPNQTIANVVQPLRNDSYFGSVWIIDDMLREGPDSSSKLIGRAQGLVAGTSLGHDIALLTTLNYIFDAGPYNGSSLAISGRAVLGTVIERPVVGGIGQFRMARGYTIAKQVSSPSDSLILEVDAYVYYYELLL